MNYIRIESNGQLTFEESSTFLKVPSTLYGFNNDTTAVKESVSGREHFCFEGTLDTEPGENICTCGAKMHINNHIEITLRHLPIGSTLSSVRVKHKQFRCPKCQKTKLQYIPFKGEGHRITQPLYQYVEDLLFTGKYTNKEISNITGIGQNTVKDIDKARLQSLYTTPSGELFKPEQTTKILGIDEFKLHDGYRYATHIIDMETGHILYIAGGKKKVVYDFIKHVTPEWMDNVEAISCDMNSDFQEAFEEKCPHIQPVFDYFHIVKNFNDKVISEVRKDEQRRLREEGLTKEADAFKKSRYILTSSRKTLEKKDLESKEGHIIHKGSTLFSTEDIVCKGNYTERYENLIKENELLFAADLIKEQLSLAYSRSNECEMTADIIQIMDICLATKNKHFRWFYNLLNNHFEGIIAHATYRISNGKIEGLNNKIKTLRRQGYGYPDDEYFFLKIIDMSRRSYIRNPKSHKILD